MINNIEFEFNIVIKRFFTSFLQSGILNFSWIIQVIIN